MSAELTWGSVQRLRAPEKGYGCPLRGMQGHVDTSSGGCGVHPVLQCTELSGQDLKNWQVCTEVQTELLFTEQFKCTL